MRTVAAAASTALALLAASCGSAPPCTTCKNVQGTYEVTMESRSADRSTCDQLRVIGGTWDVELYQTGSELDVPLMFESDGGMKGTLYADDTARFGPIKVRISNTYPAITANVTMSGGFTGEEASRRFTGAVVATTAIDGRSCSISTPVRMVKKRPTP